MKRFIIMAVILTMLTVISGVSSARADNLPFPFKVSVGVDEADSPQEVAVTLQILFMLTILSLAPAFLIMVTSFTRGVIVLSFLRRALATNQMPSNQVLIGLSLFLTFFIMAPVWKNVNEQSIQPYLKGEITQELAFRKGMDPLRQFMFKQTREKDLALFVHLSKMERPRNLEETPTHILIPAFIISELRTAFQMGFILFLPFLVIDMVVASVLLSMGMMLLPPIMISLPFKILLFVMVDGWYLIVRSLALSFR